MSIPLSLPPKLPAFISYSSLDRKIAAQAKLILDDLGFAAFLAHDDINISDEWRDRILEELRRCALFVPLLSKNFISSAWAPQEVGFVVSRKDCCILPISLDETVAFGFIAKLQSKKIKPGGITKEFLLPGLMSRFQSQVIPYLIDGIRKANKFVDGEYAFGLLYPHLSKLSATEAQTVADESIKNTQIWWEKKCSGEYLPHFLEIHGNKLTARSRTALEYQIKHHDWYNPDL